MILCTADSCFGCSACLSVCPNEAISFEKTPLGWSYPVIDASHCIECGLCQRVCPVLHPVQLDRPKEVYAVWSNDTEIASNAASAGLVTSMAKSIVEEGGVVFGTCYKKKQLVFSHTERLEDLVNFQGSKYIQAQVNNSFCLVKKYLANHRKVLFVGTPCQIAGLRNYIGKDTPYLLTIDLICHGVSTSLILDTYLKEQGISEYTNICFKGKFGSSLVVEHKGSVVYIKDKQFDLFFKSYAKGYIHRESCYKCPFARKERVGDITAGDFWGLNRTTIKRIPHSIRYISLALINSNKGEFLLDNNPYIEKEKRILDEALSKNQQLNTPCLQPADRQIFLDNFPKYGFICAIKKTSFYKKFLKDYLVLSLYNHYCNFKKRLFK